MAKEVDSKNQLWFERDNERTRIGFTQAFIDSLDQCWHILPSNLEKFKAKAPLLTVETNDALISIMSPVSGNFMSYSPKAQNFPDKLKESDVIIELTSVAQPRAQAQAAPSRGAAFVRQHLAQLREQQEGRVGMQAPQPGRQVFNNANIWDGAVIAADVVQRAGRG